MLRHVLSGFAIQDNRHFMLLTFIFSNKHNMVGAVIEAANANFEMKQFVVGLCMDWCVSLFLSEVPSMQLPVWLAAVNTFYRHRIDNKTGGRLDREVTFPKLKYKV